MSKDRDERRHAFDRIVKDLERKHETTGGIPVRENAIMWLGGMLEQSLGHPPNLPSHISVYIAARLLPILEAEEAAKRGRPGAPGAGEEAQAHIDGGMDPAQALKLVQRRRKILGQKISVEGIEAQRRKFLATTDKPAVLYKVTASRRAGQGNHRLINKGRLPL